MNTLPRSTIRSSYRAGQVKSKNASSPSQVKSSQVIWLDLVEKFFGCDLTWLDLVEKIFGYDFTWLDLMKKILGRDLTWLDLEIFLLTWLDLWLEKSLTCPVLFLSGIIFYHEIEIWDYKNWLSLNSASKSYVLPKF